MGNAVDFSDVDSTNIGGVRLGEGAGLLYIQVAVRTVLAPMMKERVMWKSKRTTDARKERTIDRLVANPFMILSEYLMTTAVMRPPRT